MALNPEQLDVQSFSVSPDSGSGDCCTGCVSGCGYFPTEGYCESASGDAVCPVTNTAA